MKLKFSFIILASFLFYQKVEAQYFDRGVLHVLEETNDKSIINNDFSKDQCGKFLKSDIVTNVVRNNRDMNECALALCGPPSENKSIYVTNRNFKKSISNDSLKKINVLEPKMLKALRLSYNQKMSSLSDAAKKITADESILNPEEWSEGFKVNLSQKIFDQFIDTVVNYDKQVDQRVRVEVNIPEGASDDFKKQLNIYAKNYENFIRNNPEKSIDLGLYTHNEQDTLSRLKLKNLKDAFNDYKNEMSESGRNQLEEQIDYYDKILSEKSELTTEMLFYEIGTGEELAEKEIPSYKRSYKALACDDKLICEKIFKDYIHQQKMSDQLKSLEDKSKDPSMLSESLISCKAQILLSASNKENEKKAKLLLDKAKTQIEKNLLPKFSAHSRSILSDRLKMLKSSADNEGPSDPIKEFDKKLDRFIESKTSANKNMSQEQALAFALNNVENPDEFNPYLSSANPCNGKQRNATDRYKKLTSEKGPEIIVSAFSCNHEVHGEFLTAHEIGHAINDIFKTIKLSSESSALHSSLRKCAIENYKPDINSKNNLDFRVEEDSADLFAFMAYPDKGLTFCSALTISTNETSYSNLDFIGSLDDVHSAPLFRIFMEAVNKDIELPISCQRAFGPYKNKLRLKKCVL